MAKIDTTKIEGYDAMTPEQKLAALEAFDVPAPDYTGWVKKETLDKATSDAADWKKKYQSTLSEADLAAQKAKESQDALNTRLAELERKDKIATTKDKYVASGFTVELAQATAEAFVDGNMDTVLENMAKHTASVEAKLKDSAMKKTPAPPAGGNPKAGEINYAEEIAKATEAGNFTEAARLVRMQSQKK